MTQAKRKTGFKEQLAAMSERRSTSGEALTVVGKSAAAEAPVNYIHTSMHITPEQLQVLRDKAAKRVALKQRARMDVSAVVRDAIDFLRENETSFDTWTALKGR